MVGSSRCIHFPQVHADTKWVVDKTYTILLKNTNNELYTKEYSITLDQDCLISIQLTNGKNNYALASIINNNYDFDPMKYGGARNAVVYSDHESYSTEYIYYPKGEYTVTLSYACSENTQVKLKIKQKTYRDDFREHGEDKDCSVNAANSIQPYKTYYSSLIIKDSIDYYKIRVDQNNTYEIVLNAEFKYYYFSLFTYDENGNQKKMFHKKS